MRIVEITVPTVIISEGEIRSMNINELKKLRKKLKEIYDITSRISRNIENLLGVVEYELKRKEGEKLRRKVTKEVNKGYVILNEKQYAKLPDEMFSYVPYRHNYTTIAVTNRLTVKAHLTKLMRRKRGTKVVVLEIWDDENYRMFLAVLVKPERLNEDVIKEAIAKVDEKELKTLKVFNTINLFK